MSDAGRGPVVSDQEILAVFESADEQRLLTREAADELPISIEELADRLDDLNERGLLVLEDEGALEDDQWSLTPEAFDEITISDEEVETKIEAQATKTTGSETSPREEETPESPPPDPQAGPLEPITDATADVLEAFDPPGTPDEQALRREALRHTYAYLRERGGAGREEFEADVFPGASGAYDSPDDWWDEVIRPGLEAHPGIIASEEDDGWRFSESRDEPTEE